MLIQDILHKKMIQDPSGSLKMRWNLLPDSNGTPARLFIYSSRYKKFKDWQNFLSKNILVSKNGMHNHFRSTSLIFDSNPSSEKLVMKYHRFTPLLANQGTLSSMILLFYYIYTV